MDELAVAALITAIGTLVIAGITLVNVKILRRQIRLAESQTILQRSGVYPFLESQNLRVDGNSLKVVLTNKGADPAFQIGLLISFHPLTLAASGEHFDFVQHMREPSTDTEIYPSKMLVYLKNTDGKSRLHPKDTAEFKGEILFWYTYFKSYPFKELISGKEVHAGKGCSFNELRALMVENSVQFLAVSIDMVYMDISERIREYEPFWDILVDLEKHKTMEDAVKDGRRFAQSPLGLEELEWIPWEQYKNMKSRRAFLEGFEPRFME